MRIHITQEDISAGHPKDPYACPIAQACWRQIPHVTSVQIGNYRYFISLDDCETREYALPNEALNFIESFDAGGPVVPFDMEVPLFSPLHLSE